MFWDNIYREREILAQNDVLIIVLWMDKCDMCQIVYCYAQERYVVITSTHRYIWVTFVHS